VGPRSLHDEERADGPEEDPAVAKQEEPQGREGMNEDELIKNLVPDPSQVLDVRMLSGFLGRSSRQGYWRLYLTLELNEYIEFPEGDVVHHQRLNTEQSPLGGTILWVRREANLQHTRTVSRETHAEFLHGGITAAFLPRMGVGAMLGLQPLRIRIGNTDVTVCQVCQPTEFAPLCPLYPTEPNFCRIR
jgi:hypothetical protein